MISYNYSSVLKYATATEKDPFSIYWDPFLVSSPTPLEIKKLKNLYKLKNLLIISDKVCRYDLDKKNLLINIYGKCFEKTKMHSFHLVDNSPWPFMGSMGALTVTLGLFYIFMGICQAIASFRRVFTVNFCFNRLVERCNS